MKRTTLAACLAGAMMLAGPGLALDLGAMTDAERSDFRAEVRAYLLENPEVLLDAFNVLEQRQQQDQVNSDLNMLQVNADEIFNDPASWVGGNPDGDITMVEFTDYRCSYCRKAHDEVAKLIETDGNIRFVIKEFPILGEASMTSARFAIAVLQLAGGDVYERANKALMTLRGEPDKAALGRLAADLGVDADAIFERMASAEVLQVIEANHALANRLQISGTPTFVIDQTMVRGYVPLDGMRQIVAGQRKN